MTIATILGNKGREVISIPSGSKLREVVALLAQRRIGAVPVCDGGRVIGVLSERDVIYHLASDGADVLDWPVDKVMTSPAITVSESFAILAALSLMTRRRVRHLPVVENEQIIGVVSIGDLVKARIDKVEAEAAAMREYIQSA